MKLSIVVALCVVGVALGTSVCVPTPNWVQVGSWVTVDNGFAQEIQFLDVATGFYRQTDMEFFDNPFHSTQIAQDVIVDSKAQKVYIIKGVPQDPKSWSCEIVPNEGTIMDPCLTYNATKISSNYIGTEKVDNYYTEDSHHGVKVYGRLLFTVEGLPVNYVTWNQLGHNEQLFLNFNTTLPTDAFAIPSICAGAKEVHMSGNELVKTYKLSKKFQPAH
jgi:hypothetical protein